LTKDRDGLGSIRVKPFGSGTFRMAHYMKLTTNWRVDSRVERMVAKLPIVSSGDTQDTKFAEENIETQLTAAFYANKFNEKGPPKKLTFVEPILVQLKTRIITAEPILSGVWTRFSNNSGFVSETEKVATVHAFSHFTYQASKGYIIVVDLQGAKEGDKYNLTDPAVHCGDTSRFGASNLGRAGFSSFFKSHRCNQVCKQLKLERHRDQELADEDTDTVTRPLAAKYKPHGAHPPKYRIPLLEDDDDYY